MARGARTHHNVTGQFTGARTTKRHETDIEIHHKHVARSYAHGGVNPWEERPSGPLPESIPTADLPEYIIGRSRMPKACPRCGHKSFTQDEMSSETVGRGTTSRLLCASPTCGYQIGWIVGNVTMMPRSAPALRVVVPENPRQIAGLVDFDLMDGCTPLCTGQTGHNPEVHEEYGRRQAILEAQSAPAEPFRSGSLYVDAQHKIYRVNGKDVRVAGISARLLCHYAARSPHIVTYEESVQIGWNVAEIDVQKYRKSEVSRWRAGEIVKSWGNLHTQINRLRQQLGDAASLLESVPGSGHRLKMEPIGEGNA